jgi:pimeloyl-ACP methyl ester carboxylesterase
MNRRFSSVVGSLGFALVLADVATARPAEWTDPSPHSVSFVGIEQGVALEVLDWGGQGVPMILLAGLGNTAHVFDQFALHFTDRYHVIGITRRGFGASAHPESGYDMGTLANDIRVACDRLGLDRVVLVGHSIAGEELTKFASTWPNRVGALVYLDAAYDRSSDQPTAPFPKQLDATAGDLTSISRLSAYLTRVFGARRPEAELRSHTVLDESGRVLRDATPDEIFKTIRANVERPDYAHVQAPALALYQSNDIRFWFANFQQFDEDDKARAEAVIKENEPLMNRSIEQFRREVVHGRAIRLTTGAHYFFLSNEDEVVRVMREFLASVIPS